MKRLVSVQLKWNSTSVQSLFIVQLYIHQKNRINITLIGLMNAIDVDPLPDPCTKYALLT